MALTSAENHSTIGKLVTVGMYVIHSVAGIPSYRVFQKEIYTFESLYTFIQRTCTVF
jgi:hypothetical protein